MQITQFFLEGESPTLNINDGEAVVRWCSSKYVFLKI